MKKYFILFLLFIFSFSAFAGDINGNNVYAKDTVRGKYSVLKKITSYPSNPSKNMVINYKDTLKIYNGVGWEVFRGIGFNRDSMYQYYEDSSLVNSDSLAKKLDAFTFGELYIDTITPITFGLANVWEEVSFRKIGYNSKTTSTLNQINIQNDGFYRVFLFLKVAVSGDNFTIINNVYNNGNNDEIGDTLIYIGVGIADTIFLKLEGVYEGPTYLNYMIKSTDVEVGWNILTASLVVTDTASLYEANMRYSDFIANSTKKTLLDSMKANLDSINLTGYPTINRFIDSLNHVRTSINGKQATLTDSSFLKYSANGIRPNYNFIAGGISTSTNSPTGTLRLTIDREIYATKITALGTTDGGLYGNSSSGIGVSAASTSGVAFSGTSNTSNAANLTQGGGASTSADILYLSRLNTGSYNSTGNIISILDNPSTSGTISGKILIATQGTRNTIILGDRVTTGTINLFDSYRHITGDGIVLAVKDTGIYKFYVKEDTTFINNKLKVDSINALSIGIMGTSANANYGIYSNKASTNAADNTCMLRFDAKPTYTGSSTSSYYGNWMTIYPIINATFTNSGYIRGSYIEVMRNANGASADDGGTLLNLTGQQLTYGHYNTHNDANPLTTNAYGLAIYPYYKTGTITNMYDIYLAASVTGGSATNKWGIYQAGIDSNRLGGTLLVGNLTTIGTIPILATYRGVLGVATSDRRLKENIKPMGNALDKVLKLKPVSFNYKSDSAKNKRLGLIYQDAVKIVPEIGYTYTDSIAKKEYGGLRYDELVSLLIKGMQEQQTQIDRLKVEIKKLKKLKK